MEAVMAANAETYEVYVKCKNCGAEGSVTSPKGVRVFGTVACPKCGCVTLEWIKG